MPHRRFWQYSLLQVHAGISHTPSHTTRTEPSTFAAECDQLRVATAATLEQQAARFESPTIKVLFELADHELRQPAALFHPLPKRRPVRPDRLIQHALFRTPPLIAVGTSGAVGARMMRSGRLGHSLAKANRVPRGTWQGFPSLEPGDESGVLPSPWGATSTTFRDGRNSSESADSISERSTSLGQFQSKSAMGLKRSSLERRVRRSSPRRERSCSSSSTMYSRVCVNALPKWLPAGPAHGSGASCLERVAPRLVAQSPWVLEPRRVASEVVSLEDLEVIGGGLQSEQPCMTGRKELRSSACRRLSHNE